MAGTNNFSKIASKFEKGTSNILRTLAFELQYSMQNKAPVDTGFLRNSIYVVTSDNSTYGSVHVTDSTGKRRKVSLKAHAPKLLPEVGSPNDKFTVLVAVGAYYAVFVELGTRKMTAKPFFFPAVDAAQDRLEYVLQQWWEANAQ